MAREISPVNSGPSDVQVQVEQDDQLQRNRSEHYSLGMEDTSSLTSNRLVHPGSKSVPPGRPQNFPSLAASNGRRSGSVRMPSRFRDGASFGTSGNNLSIHSGGSTPGGKTRWLIRNLSGDYDEPTPPATLDETVDFTFVFGSKADKNKRNLPVSDDGNATEGRGRWRKKQKERVPEQKITLFAFRLAMIEKAASNIGTMAFLWATVVILGGFATTISFVNFWVVTVIIVAEAARIFNRSHELEWQNFSTRSGEGGMLTSFFKSARHSLPHLRTSSKARDEVLFEKATKRGGGISNISNPNKKRFGRATNRGFDQHTKEKRAPLGVDGPKSGRTWSRRNIPILPFVSNLVTSKAVSRILYILQIFSALLCVGLSLWRLARQDFCWSLDVCRGGLPFDNVKISMNVFYVMAVLEAALFLMEKGYLEFKMRYGDILREVRMEVGHGRLGEGYDRIISSFYYAVYHQCLERSVFDGLDMDLVTFGIQWLQSEHFQQQLYGAKLLNQLIVDDPQHDSLAADALRRLGTTPGVIERLVEMLSWNSQEEEELLCGVASIICSLVSYERNCSRIVAVPGALDAIVSLLLLYAAYTFGETKSQKAGNEKLASICLTSLKILRYLSKTHKNSQKIGDTRGLLSILVIFIQVPSAQRLNESACWKLHKSSLKVLYLLAGATNTSGEAVRLSMARIVSGLKNLRDIIEMCDERPDLQVLAITILHHLALEDDVRSSIGATSGTLRLLFNIFQQNDAVRDDLLASDASQHSDYQVKLDRMQAVEKAGILLARLSVQNENNCLRLLNLKSTEGNQSLAEVMVENLDEQEKVATSAAEILRNVLTYADSSTRRLISVSSSPIVLRSILLDNVDPKSVFYQVSLGLASQALDSFPLANYREAFGLIDKKNYIAQLLRNLKHTPTTKKFPRIRRYTVELVLALIAKDDYFLEAFDAYSRAIKTALEDALDSVSEVENFILFSGVIGYARHTEDMGALIVRCIQAVEHYHNNCRLNPTSPSLEEALS